jgi:hypothetical protein
MPMTDPVRAGASRARPKKLPHQREQHDSPAGPGDVRQFLYVYGMFREKIHEANSQD